MHTFFYINMNQQKSGKRNHEVHTPQCPHFYTISRIHRLGEFTDCHAAIKEGKKLGYPNVDGCRFCCKDCNTENVARAKKK